MSRIVGLLCLLLLLLASAGCGLEQVRAEPGGGAPLPDSLVPAGPEVPRPEHIDTDAQRVLFQFSFGTGRKVYEFKVLTRRAD